ncbi:NADP-dependent oxidoreductase [uncultured Pseudokineococcus sp.]|uniref:NADP-dependent oxidoreductase n=1 Tax=uncultured Pseudokineococcus sp. TaxID=1642928 RepID=UPI00260B4199|nr:NADP-dependent oxidoreductase [uncultured Pseudokineococcus sp.]
MRAVQHRTFGDPADALEVVDVDEPHAGPGAVRVVVGAAGVNPVDWKAVRGAMAGASPGDPVPGGARTPGVDVAGVVDEVGDGVDDVAVGDRVVGWAASGALAEHAVLEDFARLPEAVATEQAATLPVPGETALRVLELLDFREGQTLLVDGGSGAVGIATTQIALSRGLTVVATASEANQDFLRQLGAVPTTYGEGLVERVRALAPEGVDAALDAAGKGSARDLVELVGDPGRVVTIADFSAGDLGVVVSTGDDQRARRLREVVDLAAQGVVLVPVARTYPLEDAVAAYEESAGGHVRGKLLVTPR